MDEFHDVVRSEQVFDVLFVNLHEYQIEHELNLLKLHGFHQVPKQKLALQLEEAELTVMNHNDPFLLDLQYV